MMRLIYPLIASALITIVPFLVTFEKGQDIVRGLFGFEEFTLLLLFAWVKSGLRHPGQSAERGGSRRKVLCYVAMFFIVVVMVVVAFADLSNLLAIKGWDMGWRAVLPIVTCCFAVVMVWKVPAFSFPTINLIVFVSLIAHLFAYNNYAEQPLAQFPVINYLDRTAPKPVERKKLPEDFLAKYDVMDSAFISRRFLDTSRSNVLILVESWGIPLDNERFERELDVFRQKGFVDSSEGNMLVGAHSRMYSRTRTAEREDLIFNMVRDSVTRRRDTTFIPQVLGASGVGTYFLFGGDSTEQWRHWYIRNVGFQNILWNEEHNDAEMSAKLDSVLGTVQLANESAQGSSAKIFAAWTTRDTKFPLPGLGGNYAGSADANDSAYTERLMGSLQMIADLARRYPNVRFIVQGDHEPILSPLSFQERFYKRWVPFVVLN